jgi:uncharacterized protein YabE (DUF348 family)
MKSRHSKYPKEKKRLARHYDTVRGHGARHIQKRPYILPILGFLLGIGIVAAVVYSHGGRPLQASDSHVVFLFDKGRQETLDTKAKTVGELVKKLPLHLVPEDVVEPSLDTVIVEDNFRVNVYRSRPVTVVGDSGNKTVTVTAQKSPRVVAQDAGLTVYPEDKTSFAQGTLKENIIGEKVVVDRATPVFFNLYGTPLTVRTHTKTVGDLLKEKGVKVASGDQLQPSADTPLTPSLQVFVVRMGSQIATVEENIPAPTQIIQDASLSLGASATRQAGAPGKKAVTYQIQTQNNKETGRTAIQEVIVQDPVPSIIARGTRVLVSGDKTSWMAGAGISEGDYGYVNYIVSHESNWSYQAQNSSGTYGLCQALPGSKMASAGADWQSNPVTQLRWCSGYAASKFGGWGGAYNYWVSHHYW